RRKEVCLVYLVCLVLLVGLPVRPTRQTSKRNKRDKPNEPERRELRGSPQVVNPIRRDLDSGSAMSSRMASKTTRNWPSYFFSSSLRRRASPLFVAIISRS